MTSIAQSQNILNLSRPIICVVGPTASGKTALAQELALLFDGEVVSADSMQIYKGMNIGTGKPPQEDLKVPHHGFDLLDPGMPYSAALFQEFARNCFCRIDAAGKTPILCGGTGFYIRAAIDGYDFPEGDQLGNATRDYYNAFAQEHGSQALWELLKDTDAKSADLIAPNDTKRVVRAFELLEDNTSYATQHENLTQIPQVVPAIMIGLALDPDILNKRIDKRVDKMIESGLLDEVKLLLEGGFREGICAAQAIGYKELVPVIESAASLEDAIAAIKQATHRYGKRQRTWFRKDKRIYWIEVNNRSLERITDEAQAIIAQELQTRRTSS